jgi:putative transposase
MLTKSDVLLVVHVDWSTLGREVVFGATDDAWLSEFLTRAAADLGCEALAVGNAGDHVHLLVCLAPVLALCELVRKVKGGSAHAWNLRFPERRLRWQGGYWARSVHPHDLDELRSYVLEQRRRHALEPVTAVRVPRSPPSGWP